MLPNTYTYYYSINPHHSFIPGLKTFFSANPSQCSLPFLLQDWLHRFPGLFTNTSEHIRFLLFSFSGFFSILVVGSVREIKLIHVSFRAYIKIASRIVSYKCRTKHY